MGSSAIITADQASAGGIKNLVNQIASASKGLESETALYFVSRMGQSLQNQINQLLGSARASAASAAGAGTPAFSYILEVQLVAGANTISNFPPGNVGDLLTVFLTGPGAACSVTWNANFDPASKTEVDTDASTQTRFLFVGKTQASGLGLLWFQAAPAESFS